MFLLKSFIDGIPAFFDQEATGPKTVDATLDRVHTYKPVLDDARFRSFDTMEDYRKWCEANLPDWLGYGRVYKLKRYGTS